MQVPTDVQGNCNHDLAVAVHSGAVGETAGQASSSRDRTLVVDAQSGCRVAFAELWNLYSRRLYRTLLCITKNSHDAEDALQDAFLRAFQALNRFEGRSSFYSWLTRIAINSAFGILRKRRTCLETILNVDLEQEDGGGREEFRDLAPDPEQIYTEEQGRKRLMDAIHRLPLGYRTAIEMRVSGDCSIKDVACRLNISEAAAKSRLYRARIRLVELTAFPARCSRYRSSRRSIGTP